MEILVDTHVHSTASGHAYSSIDEIARFASQTNLDIVALTDHAPAMPGGAHMLHFANIGVLPEFIHGVRILKGIEANIIDYEGNLDFDNDLLERLQLELVIASFHPPCIESADQETVTRAVMKTIENPYVHIIGHPGDNSFPMDLEKVVVHAKKHHVLLEVNNASLKPNSVRVGIREALLEILKYSVKYDHPIIVASDAHFHEHVGKVDESIQLLKEVNFPKELIINLNQEKFMKFVEQGVI